MNKGIRVYQGFLTPDDIRKEAESRIRNLEKESEQFQPLKEAEDGRHSEIAILKRIVKIIEEQL